jgi:hypothetical protein
MSGLRPFFPFLRPSGGYQDKMAGLCAWFHWPAGVQPRPAGVMRMLELQGTGDLFDSDVQNERSS